METLSFWRNITDHEEEMMTALQPVDSSDVDL